MKVQHSTVIQLPPEVTALAFKRSLEDIPDDAIISIEVEVIEADRPWESRRTKAVLRAAWEAPAFT